MWERDRAEGCLQHPNDIAVIVSGLPTVAAMGRATKLLSHADPLPRAFPDPDLALRRREQLDSHPADRLAPSAAEPTSATGLSQELSLLGIGNETKA